MSDTTWLFASDVHFPLHDPRALDLWFDVLDYLKPGAIDLLGDIDDAGETSRWVEGTSKEGFSLDYAGITLTKQFLADIHEKSPAADKHFHDGNHGWFRHQKWLDKNAPSTLKDGVYSPQVLYDHQNSGFEWHEYSAPPVHRYGDIYAHHGESISKHAGESVRNDCQSYGVSLIRGHSHRQGEYFQTYPLTGQTLRGYEIGHLCDPRKMDYDRSPNWQQGFGYGIISGNEVFIDTIEIRNYSCAIGTKVFHG